MQKIPKQIEALYHNENEYRICKYNFVFSNKLRDWIYSSARIANNKSKFEMKEDKQ